MGIISVPQAENFYIYGNYTDSLISSMISPIKTINNQVNSITLTITQYIIHLFYILDILYKRCICISRSRMNSK